MAQINFDNKNRKTYDGVAYWEAAGYVNPEFEARVVCKDKKLHPDEEMVVVDISAVDPDSGERCFITCFPENEATANDIKRIKENPFLSDVRFYIGFAKLVNKKTGAVEVKLAKHPKWSFAKDMEGQRIALQGAKMEIDEQYKLSDYELVDEEAPAKTEEAAA